jgi:hypothetical protein
LNKTAFLGLIAFALALILPSAFSVTTDMITIDNKLNWLGMGNLQRVDANGVVGNLFFQNGAMTLYLPSKTATISFIGTNFVSYSAKYNDAVLSVDGNPMNDCNASVKFHGTASYVSLPNANNKFVVFIGVVSVNPLNCSVAPFSFVVTGKGTSTGA